MPSWPGVLPVIEQAQAGTVIGGVMLASSPWRPPSTSLRRLVVVARPLESVFADLLMQATVAPWTPWPASVTLNVTVVAWVWLNFDGLAVSVSPARIWVCQNSIGFGAALGCRLMMTSSRPKV